MTRGPSRTRVAALVAALAVICIVSPASAATRAVKPTGLRVTAADQRAVAVTWRPPPPPAGYRYRLYLNGHRVRTTRSTAATLDDLQCGRSYVVEVESRREKKRRSRRVRRTVATNPCRAIDLSERCNGQNCDAAFE